MKICKECKIEKPLTEYYGNGSATECKDCAKKRVKLRTEELKKNPEWVEKEKIRAREKYYRLGYREKHKPSLIDKKRINQLHKQNFPEKFKARNASQRIQKSKKENHLHHWSYNQSHWKEVFELSNSEHSKAHRYMIYDQEFMMYRRTDTMELLDTREKHQDYIFNTIKDKL